MFFFLLDVVLFSSEVSRERDASNMELLFVDVFFLIEESALKEEIETEFFLEECFLFSSWLLENFVISKLFLLSFELEEISESSLKTFPVLLGTKEKFLR